MLSNAHTPNMVNLITTLLLLTISSTRVAVANPVPHSSTSTSTSTSTNTVLLPEPSTSTNSVFFIVYETTITTTTTTELPPIVNPDIGGPGRNPNGRNYRPHPHIPCHNNNNNNTKSPHLHPHNITSPPSLSYFPIIPPCNTSSSTATPGFHADNAQTTPTTDPRDMRTITTDPLATPPPSQDAALAEMGYRQTTYYSCATFARTTQCGWYQPLIRVENNGGGGVRAGGVGVVVWAAVLAFFVLM